VNRRLIVEVEDDGVGIGRNDMDQYPGVGISGMKARLREIGGRLTISRLCPGTLVRASVELPTASERLRPPRDYAVRKYRG
jgi:signal transduction histidine kinase